MIEVKNLVKQYGAHFAVNDMSFTIESGKIYGLLGTNGAGKSTTMNIITGYMGSTSGDVIVNGHNILEEPEEVKKYIGYLPEAPPLYLEMTVREYLFFAAELKKMPKDEIEKNVAEVISLVKLEGVEKRLIRNLSKGYRQRVGLAQAILGFPEIIILDEPTVGLDPLQIIEIRDLIKSLAKKHTILLSSHILSEVSAICDHVLIISKGRLVASDSPENLERLMSGRQTLELAIKGSQSEVEEILASVEGIQNMECTSSYEEGVQNVKLQVEDGFDIREAVFFAFAAKGCPIFGMKVTKASLEDVFLELTNENQDQEAAAPEDPAGITSESGDSEPDSQEPESPGSENPKVENSAHKVPEPEAVTAEVEDNASNL